MRPFPASNTDLLRFFFFFLFFRYIISCIGSNLPVPYYPADDIAINYGSKGNSSALDGREWVGDISSKFSLSRKQTGKSISTRAVHTSLSGDPVPYLTARASHSPFFYTFKLHPGQKFIRLHFNPASYLGFERSRDLFTVQAGPHKLLSNFSASLTAGASGFLSFSKEFCVNVEENEELTVTFSPSSSIPNLGDRIYAFVNGLEVISMPSGLYYTPESGLGAHVVGQKHKFYIDNNTALEMVHRLNLGGSSVSPIEDTGMFRRWYKDTDYLSVEDDRVLSPLNYATSMIKYTASTPSFTAPLKVYQTAWSRTGSNNKAKQMYSLKWKLPVDLGFRYLIRLHFCQHEPANTKRGRVGFSISINNQIAESDGNMMKWSGGYGIAMYKDYIVIMRGDKMEGKHDLIIMLSSKGGSMEGILNGIEVFKLSNPDDNLGGSNPKPIPSQSPFWTLKLGGFVSAFGSLNAFATRVTIIITALNVMVYIQRYLLEEKIGKEDILSNQGKLCRYFSLAEIQKATNYFDEALVIGIGGFAKVYKGVLVDDGAKKAVAIKRLSSRSQEGDREYWAEIEMICKLRHNHLVSLIGYCNDGQEMILVYEYMPNGTLAEHLYYQGSKGSNYFPLTWEQRLKICIGAARGLDYLHTGTHHGVIHRDVKTTNILLDEMLVGKISDFGLSSVENNTNHPHHSYISTNIKGTVGYLDPDYFLSRKLSRKSDVYAFGVVLFEVLCGRPAVETGLDEEQRSLAIWARHCIREGKLDHIIDPSLRGKISPHCMKIFTQIAEKCLDTEPRKRPSMANLVSSLELALAQQERADWSISEDEAYIRAAHGTSSSSQISDYRYIMSPPSKETSNSKLASKKNLKYKKWKSWKWDSLWNGAKSSKPDSFSLKIEVSCRRFTMTEIQSATNNFNNDLIVGVGEFSTVYKGHIDDGYRKVAVKRLEKFIIEDLSKKNSDWASDFCEEVEMLSKLHHPHMVSLIGYCYHNSEMILIYDYMVNGNLRNHLYGRNNMDPLTWKHRLQICIDTAQALDFLHRGGGQIIIHRDIHPGNIMLDEKWVAKVSDYGLTKVGPMYAILSNLTCVLGTCLEYLDPEFVFSNGITVTEKSDVYSFGLVMLEVLCGRKLEDHTLRRDRVFLRSWVKSSIQNKTVHQTVDPCLKGKVAPECLREFIRIAEICLADKGVERPSMGEVVKSLEFALHEQEAAEASKLFDARFDINNM